MIKLRTFILLPILLFACRPISGVPEDTVSDPNTDANGQSETDSPRLPTDAPPTETVLPPTWTPLPIEERAHLPESSNDSTGFGPSTQPSTPEPYDGPTFTYIVQRGDTLAEICNEYGVSISEVARINNLTDWDHIEVGQRILIPDEQ
jgi:LysM repeat protein